MMPVETVTPFDKRLEIDLGENFHVEEIIIAGDRGPCGGVNMAVEVTFEVLGLVAGREDVYANNDPVHNDLLTAEFERQGLIIRPDIKSIPDGSILIASAHGWSPKDKEIAKRKNLLVIDVTCQLVEKVGRAAQRAVAEGKHVLYVGSDDHPEPRGILGRLPEGSYTFINIKDDAPKIRSPLVIFDEDDMREGESKVLKANVEEFAVLNQTTLSTVGVVKKIEELREVNPYADIPDPMGICYATGNRQEAVRERLFDSQSEPIDALFVTGSKSSHNSTELKDVGEIERKIPSYLINSPEEIDPSWFNPDIKRVMITSGASVLDPYLLRVIKYFTDRGARPTFIQSREKKPKIDPQTREPIINPDTGEQVYEELFFVGPDLDLLWKRYERTSTVN